MLGPIISASTRKSAIDGVVSTNGAGEGARGRPFPRGRSPRFERYGTLTVVPSPALVIEKVPEVVEL